MDLYRIFLERYTNLKLDLIYRDTLPDLKVENIDLVLAIGDVAASSHYDHFHLCWIDYALAASPMLMARHDTPSTPADLKNLPCINCAEPTWRLFKDDKTVTINMDWRLRSHNIPACIDACLSGLGVFIIPAYNLETLVSNGRLIHLLPGWQVRKALHAIVPHQRYIPAKVIVLLEFLWELMGNSSDEGSLLATNIKLPANSATGIMQKISEGSQRASRNIRTATHTTTQQSP